MANPEHLEILKQGVEAWNQWREENPGIIPDLENVDLGGTYEYFLTHLKMMEGVSGEGNR